MNQGRIGLAIASTVFLLAGPAARAEEPRAEERVATVERIDINEKTAVLALSDDSVLEVPLSDIRVRRDRRDSARGTRAAKASASSARAPERRAHAVLRAEQLKELVDTEGAQPLLLRVKYDNQGRIRAVRGEIHESEAAARAEMTRRTASRAEAAARRDGVPVQE